MSSRLAVPLFLLLVLAACDNPTGVGSGLVDTDGGIPEIVTLSADAYVESALADSSGSTIRILSGQTDDPDLGSIAATGFVDFTYPPSRSDAFNNGGVSAATLVLTTNYAYGDTTGSVSFRLRSLVDEWDTTGRRVDTTLTVADEITTFSFDVGSTSIDVPLPPAWIARWDSTLRGSTLSSNFHGIAIEAVSGNAVVGFNRLTTQLRIVSGGETALYPISKALTTLAFAGDPILPPDRVLFQDGRHASIGFTFDVSEASLSRSVINRATLSLRADTSLTADAPPGYVRPQLFLLRLDAVFSDPASRSELTFGLLDADGQFIFENNRIVRTLELDEDGTLNLDRFELRVSAADNSLGVLLLDNSAASGFLPTLNLTVVRAD